MWLDIALCLLAFTAGAGPMALDRRRLTQEIERLNRLIALVRAALNESERLR